MGTLFIKIIEISAVATFLMVAVILVRFLLKKTPKWFMGVLWSIVAVRLLFPFQIEASVGFLPRFGDSIESFFYGVGESDNVVYVMDNSEMAAGEVVTHEYTPNEALEISPEDGVTDYLPNEQIIAADSFSDTSANSLSWRRDLFIRLQMVWLFGLLVILAYAVFSYISIRKKTRESIRLENEENVFVCDEIDTPFILGVFKPVIYLPSGLDGETVKNVLAHEKAHIKRLDYLRKQFGFLILAVYWFNPFVWISYALFCKDIELACDEKVISHMSLDEKKSYANSLLLCSTHKRLVLAYPLAFGEVGVGTRIKQIFNYRKPTIWLLLLLVVVCVALSSGFFTSASKGDYTVEDTGIESGIMISKDSFVEKWCEDFKDSNAQGILDASNEEVQNTLVEEGLLDVEGDYPVFGWSSPWPGMNPNAESSCAFTYTDDEKTEAEIFYAAIDSEPHVYLWKETIKIEQDDKGNYKVVSEEFVSYEDIKTADDYDNIWDASSMLGNALDYTQNGLGEQLNKNALENRENYEKLFDPITAVRYLLNLSEDDSKVTLLPAESPEVGTFIGINFGDADYDIAVGVIQPWGSDGIYVPVRNLQLKEGKNSENNDNDDETEFIIDSEGEYNSNLPNAQGNEGKWVDLQYASISDYFKDSHEHRSMQVGYTEEADLDGDGTLEKIVVENLGYNGGDGGYLPHGYRADGKEIELPINAESNPYAILWGEEKVEIFREDVEIASLSWDEVKQIYLNNGYTEDEYEELKSHMEKDAWIVGDSASGFVVSNNGDTPELVIKFYMQGMGSHVDTLGYVLMHLTLNSDGTWNQVKDEFVLDM